MGSVGVTLGVDGGGDRAALHAAIWATAREFIDRYTAPAAYPAVYDYLGVAVRRAEADGTWGPAGGRLGWWFTDHGRADSRSAYLWVHWLRLALSAEWTRMTEHAADHSLTIAEQRPDLGALLADRGTTFVTLRSDVWLVGADGLSADGRDIALADLDDAERARHAEATRRCRCGMCDLLRPEPDVRATMVDSLTRPETRQSAAWYLSRAHEASAGTLVAFVRAGQPGPRSFALRPAQAAGDGAMADLLPAVERYAPRVPGAFPAVLAALPDLDGGARGLALYALAATYGDDADRDRLLAEARASLGGTDEATQAAAEIAGRIGRGVAGLPAEVAAVLDRDISAAVRHNAVLGLVNLHLPPAPPPDPTVRARLEREAATDTDAGRLAKWLLSAFPA
jgi:hypothetical protein